MNGLPKISNSHRFAASGETVSGSAPVIGFERLLERIPENVDVNSLLPLSWAIRGTKDALGRPALEISVDGVFPLTCQRCLGRLDWTIKQTTTVLIASSETELAALDDASEMEVVLCAGGIDAAALIEDELLLALPFAPMHEEMDAQCAMND
ncbi:MAG: DUF177 domain-containing protein [Burkholderiales bacterium]|jgi:uncharacterized protein|nr:DUF177 domain-containing protein [Burkholderiales bacterium]